LGIFYIVSRVKALQKIAETLLHGSVDRGRLIVLGDGIQWPVWYKHIFNVSCVQLIESLSIRRFSYIIDFTMNQLSKIINDGLYVDISIEDFKNLICYNQ
jgi:hypothetical protein